VSWLARRFLFHPVYQDDKCAHGQDTRNDSDQRDVIHCLFSPVKRVSIPETGYCTMWAKFLPTVIIAGPTTTTPILGKIKNTSGGTSLIVVLAAISSAC
jgi:hypothetical protein